MPPVRFAGALVALAALALPMSASAAPTDLDATFGESGTRTTALGGDGFGSDLLVAPGGKLVAVGSAFNGAGYDWVLARYGADGAPDETFDHDGVVMSVSPGRPVGGTAADVDGSGGVYFTGTTTGSELVVAHVDVDGVASLPMTVEPATDATETAGRAVVALPDGKVLVAGDAMTPGGLVGFVARFEADGDPDAAFGSGGVLLLPDTVCGTNCVVSSLVVSGSDAYVGATALGSPSAGRVIRVTDLGTVDSGYGAGIGGGVMLDAYGITGVEDLVIADGRIVAAGIAGSGIFECAVTALTNDGSVDMAFGTNGVGRIQRGSDCRAYDVAVDDDGRLTFAGRTSDDAGLIGRFTATGNPDSTFVLGGAVAVTPGGAQSFRGAVMQNAKLVVAGDTTAPHKLLLARYQGGVIMLGGSSGSGSDGSGSGVPASAPSTPSPAATPATPADTIAPRIVIRYPADKARTTDPTPTFSGSASQDNGDNAAPVLELRQVLSGGRLGTPMLVDGARSGAYWSATAPKLADGTWRARAMLGDAAGNTGESAATTLAVGKLATPRNTGRFSVVGTPEAGEIVGVRATKSWSPATDLTIRYRWQRCDDGCRWASPASESDVYRVQSADRGHRLRAFVYAGNPDRRAPAKRTGSSAMVPKPDQIPFIANRGFPRVLGGDDLAVDDTVRADEGDWRGSPSPFRYSYRWQVCRAGGWCSNVGTGSTYRVRSTDQGHRINLIVTAANRAGSNYAWSGTGAVVQGSRTANRRAVVTDSYQRVFGRAPRTDELTYWMSRSDNLTTLVANHQRYIRDNRWMADEVVRRAYEKVYGHGPWANDTEYTANQMAQFNADVEREWRSGATYDDVVSQLARDLANQAIERIFFWRNDPGNAKLVEAHIRTKDVSMFVERVRRDVYAKGGATRGENLWTDVALSNDPVRGAARTTYPGQGSTGAADRENCYGAVGPGCTGVMGGAASRSVVTDNFVTLDGRKMSYLQVTTAVGSIAHDAMCRVYPWTSYLKGDNGVWCGDAPADPTEVVPIGKIFFTGAAEWNKATANTLQGRKWDAMYGPYPTPDARFAKDSKHARTYSDDLRPAVRQERWMELTRGGWILGIADLDKPFGWQGKEIRGSLRLSAPLGTKLDASDKDFCQSGRFQHSAKWVAGQRMYNHCA